MKETLSPLEKKVLIRLLKQLLKEDNIVGEGERAEGTEERTEVDVESVLATFQSNLDQVRVEDVFVIFPDGLSLTGEGGSFAFHGNCFVTFELNKLFREVVNETIQKVGEKAWAVTLQQRKKDITEGIRDKISKIVDEVMNRLLGKNFVFEGANLKGNPKEEIAEFVINTLLGGGS